MKKTILRCPLPSADSAEWFSFNCIGELNRIDKQSLPFGIEFTGANMVSNWMAAFHRPRYIAPPL